MIYFDTAYLAKCYLNEPGAETMRQLASESSDIGCSQSGEVEWCAVFHRHLRESKISAIEFQVVIDQFLTDQTAAVGTWYPVIKELLAESAQVFHHLSASVFLKAADALHLTCARRKGLDEVYTNDRHMLLASAEFGIVGRNII